MGMYKTRRRAKKVVNVLEVVANAKNPAQHKTGKLSCKENIKTTTANKEKTSGPSKRKMLSYNCKRFHLGKFHKPNYSGKQ